MDFNKKKVDAIVEQTKLYESYIMGLQEEFKQLGRVALAKAIIGILEDIDIAELEAWHQTSNNMKTPF